MLRYVGEGAVDEAKEKMMGYNQVVGDRFIKKRRGREFC
jgi:hypothetical protein